MQAFLRGDLFLYNSIPQRAKQLAVRVMESGNEPLMASVGKGLAGQGLGIVEICSRKSFALTASWTARSKTTCCKGEGK